uniref:MAT112 n=1 Tax=Huntiella omanensis TaxID=1580864 RepID=A0A1D9CT31_9PEZI|nr:MAT112 [Huntiella omanensis]
MSSELTKIPASHLEQEIPLSLDFSNILDLQHEIYLYYLWRKRQPRQKQNDMGKSWANMEPVDCIKRTIVHILEHSDQVPVTAVRALSHYLQLPIPNLIQRLMKAWHIAAAPCIVDLDLTTGVALQGYRAIAYTTCLWKMRLEKTDPEGQGALIANSCTTVIVAALMIVTWMWRTKTTADCIAGMKDEPDGDPGIEVFVRFAWDQILPPPRGVEGLPGRDLGLRPAKSVKFDEKLHLELGLREIANTISWIPMPYLHPAYQVYGSGWQKLLRNRGHSFFYEGDLRLEEYKDRPLTFAVPVQTLEALDEMRLVYQQRKHELIENDGDVPEPLPFEEVAKLSGHDYPNLNGGPGGVRIKKQLLPLAITQPSGIGQACRYPLTDLTGNLSLNMIETILAHDMNGSHESANAPDVLVPQMLNRQPDSLMVFKVEKMK